VGGVQKRCWVLWVCGNIFGGGGISLANFVRLEVGDGSHVCFWHDCWYGERFLKQCYSDLFSIVRNKDAMVAKNLVVQNGVIQWNVIFTRPIQEWEMEMILSFVTRLYSISVRHGEDDMLIWNLSKRSVN
jgi:hypothetical protein